MGYIAKPNVRRGTEVKKGWGKEIIIENNDQYCGKLLIFNKGCRFSMHYHMLKDETWYVQEGHFLYKWIDVESGTTKENILHKGDVVRVLPGQPHQLTAYQAGVIFEVSTQHFDSDSYRVYKGD
tara:strand:+ start:132 stop:503 length:372 start_codon:yes stop_codon:yes gene_type:complete